jgi:hypothetical protein
MPERSVEIGACQSVRTRQMPETIDPAPDPGAVNVHQPEAKKKERQVTDDRPLLMVFNCAKWAVVKRRFAGPL